MARTNGHKKSQKSKDLSVAQLNAIDLLILGKTDQEVAKAIKVSRETINRWRNQNPHFIVSLNRKRQEIWSSSQERLRCLIGKAIDTIEAAVEEGDVRAAIEVLKAVRLYGQIDPPKGHTQPEFVMRQLASTKAQEEHDLEEEIDLHSHRFTVNPDRAYSFEVMSNRANYYYQELLEKYSE